MEANDTIPSLRQLVDIEVAKAASFCLIDGVRQKVEQFKMEAREKKSKEKKTKVAMAKLSGKREPANSKSSGNKEPANPKSSGNKEPVNPKSSGNKEPFNPQSNEKKEPANLEKVALEESTTKGDEEELKSPNSQFNCARNQSYVIVH
jgi:hypothetical protein